jgi:hypothetical protein
MTATGKTIRTTIDSNLRDSENRTDAPGKPIGGILQHHCYYNVNA